MADMATDLLLYRRVGNITHVTLGDTYLGMVKRQEGSDSSPRSGAFRIFHYAVTAAGKRFGRSYSRKEAVEDLLRDAGRWPLV